MRACTRFAFGWLGCGVLAAIVACSDGAAPLMPSIVGRGVRAAGAAPSPVRISGRTIDWRSGAGVAGVTVELGGLRTASDATGVFTLTLPSAGPYDPIVAGLSSGVSHVSGAAYRGDFLVNAGTCVSRYGTVTSARTAAPLAGAVVTVGTVTTTTGADGWYRADLGCPSGPFGVGPGPFTVTKPGYFDASSLETRGFFLSVRIDVELIPDSG